MAVGGQEAGAVGRSQDLRQVLTRLVRPRELLCKLPRGPGGTAFIERNDTVTGAGCRYPRTFGREDLRRLPAAITRLGLLLDELE